MFPRLDHSSIDIEAISGICGSISIACWIVVFSPQIIENFRRKSAEGLSIVFLVIWLLGDVFNILGALLQGVLPTMIILAVYYTLADIVLMIQVFYYRGFTLSDKPKTPAVVVFDDESIAEPDEHRPLLDRPSPDDSSRRRSFGEEFRRHLRNAGAEHLSPATPLLDAKRDQPVEEPTKSRSVLRTVLFDACAVIVVIAAGIFGWWATTHHSRASHTHRHRHHTETDPRPNIDSLQFDTLGQVFGYLCAALYLGSRVPQLLLNYRRKSTEGVSLLFFLFACLGNLTYDMSIFAYEPRELCERGPHRCHDGEARRIYARYIAVNASWIIGSLGTLALDGAIFAQFFWYRNNSKPVENVAVEDDQ